MPCKPPHPLVKRPILSDPKSIIFGRINQKNPIQKIYIIFQISQCLLLIMKNNEKPNTQIHRFFYIYSNFSSNAFSHVVPSFFSNSHSKVCYSCWYIIFISFLSIPSLLPTFLYFSSLPVSVSSQNPCLRWYNVTQTYTNTSTFLALQLSCFFHYSIVSEYARTQTNLPQISISSLLSLSNPFLYYKCKSAE